MSMYVKRGFSIDTNLFERGINSLWRKNRDRTEELILNLLSQSNLMVRYSGVKLICMAHDNLNIDLLKIKESKCQRLSIRALLNYPHSIEKLLPIVIRLKESVFPEVIEELQESLNFFITEAYGKGIYDLIINLLDAKKDAKLLKSFTKTLSLYSENIERKNLVKDLNPYYNENDLMNYYYGLENESMYKLTKEVSEKSSFSAFVTTRNIVRGNSWRFGEREASPLSNYSFSLILDKRMILNSDLFEMNLSNSIYIND
jgi:hypothetical protein